MAWVDQLDADGASVDVGLAAPIRNAGMPGPVSLVNKRVDAAVLIDQVMRAGSRRRIAEPRQRRRRGLHASVMENQDVDGRARRAFIVVRGSRFPHLRPLSFSMRS